jgi:hypothetical protein
MNLVPPAESNLYFLYTPLYQKLEAGPGSQFLGAIVQQNSGRCTRCAVGIRSCQASIRSVSSATKATSKKWETLYQNGAYSSLGGASSIEKVIASRSGSVSASNWCLTPHNGRS